MKNLRLLALCILVASFTSTVRSHETSILINEMQGEAPELEARPNSVVEKQHDTAAQSSPEEHSFSTLCTQLFAACDDMSDQEHALLLETANEKLSSHRDTQTTRSQRMVQLPQSLTRPYTNSRYVPRDTQQSSAEEPTKDQPKKRVQTLYMVSTGPQRALLPNPTSHRRHGPLFLMYSMAMTSPLWVLITYALHRFNVPLVPKILAAALIIGAAYGILYHQHSLYDKEEVCKFLKHRWPKLSEEMDFSDNIKNMMNYLRKKLLSGTLDSDEMMECMDAIQNSGQNE
jgi:hypothetical protein